MLSLFIQPFFFCSRAFVTLSLTIKIYLKKVDDRLCVDSDKVIGNDQDHGDTTDTIGKSCELSVGYHLRAVI